MVTQVTKLETLRREKELTRADLADKVGISARTIERYEQRIISLEDAKYKIVIALSKVLEVTPDELIE